MCAIFRWLKRTLQLRRRLIGRLAFHAKSNYSNTCSIPVRISQMIISHRRICHVSFSLCLDSKLNKWLIFQRVGCCTPMFLFRIKHVQSAFNCMWIGYLSVRSVITLDSIELLTFWWIKIEFWYLNWWNRVQFMYPKPPLFQSHSKFMILVSKFMILDSKFMTNACPFTSSVDIELAMEI